MTKKSLLLMLSLVLALTIGLGSTLAYLTDTDAEVNTFTIGDVDIDLIEEKYEQDQKINPGIEVDKEVHIENTGDNEAWVWYTVAIPLASNEEGAPELIVPTYNENELWTEMGDPQYLEIDGEPYNIHTFLWNEKLAAGAATDLGLTDIKLHEHIDYDPIADIYKLVDAGVDYGSIGYDLTSGKVYVNAFAIQTEGFETIDEAYAGFMGQWTDGNGYTEEMINVGSDENKPAEGSVLVKNEVELKNALEKADGKTIVLGADFPVDESLEVTGDVTIDMNGFDLDASGVVGRPFEMADGSSLTINAGDSEFKVGAHGLVNVPAGNDAVITLNGGNYFGEVLNGSLIKPRGDGEIVVNLNDVNYSDTSATQDGWVINSEGTNVTVNVKGGEYTSPRGFMLQHGELNLTDANLTMTDTTTSGYAVVSYYDEANISGCTINTQSRSIAPGFMATINIENSSITSEKDHALYAFTSGGTINVNNSEIEGHGSNGDYYFNRPTYSGAVSKIVIDGVNVYEKKAN